MQLITGSVGEGGTNEKHDVALVQAILLKTTRAAAPVPSSGTYLATYDGIYGKDTLAAIRSFQNDHVFVSAQLKQSVGNPNATAGLVVPNDATWTELLLKVPAEFSDLRVLTDGKTVYVAATDSQRDAMLAAVGGLTFAFEFRTRVVACINQMHALHGIAVGVCRDGDRRTFQTQYDLFTSGRGVTNAGPGESNHNFGMASDIGFAGLRWLRSNGAVVHNETSWLHQLDPLQHGTSPEAVLFWDALRTVGTSAAVGAFRGPVRDRPHLQNWSDAGVVMAARLADLLQRSGTMRWAAAHGAYQCDLGLGGALYAVGTAAQIWNSRATITAAMLTQARAAAAARAVRAPANAAAAEAVRRAAVSAAARTTQARQVPAGRQQNRQPMPPVRSTPPATAADVTAMRRSLRDQMDLADANWEQWRPR